MSEHIIAFCPFCSQPIDDAQLDNDSKGVPLVLFATCRECRKNLTVTWENEK